MSGVRENNHDPFLTPTLGKVAELPSYRFRMMRRTGSSIASTSPLVHCVRAHALSVVAIGRGRRGGIGARSAQPSHCVQEMFFHLDSREGIKIQWTGQICSGTICSKIPTVWIYPSIWLVPLASRNGTECDPVTPVHVRV
jgi:hypothetical protein